MRERAVSVLAEQCFLQQQLGLLLRSVRRRSRPLPMKEVARCEREMLRPEHGFRIDAIAVPGPISGP